MSKKKTKNILKTYKSDYKGQDIVVTQYKPKEKRTNFNATRHLSACPNCLSSIHIDKGGAWYCTGDRLKVWETEFERYHLLDNPSKAEFIKNISIDTRFFELYDRWVYAKEENKPEEYNCGYTNKIFLPIASNETIIPDPLKVINVEKSLGRPLTEKELDGETELWLYKGRISDKYRKGSKKIRIEYISFPQDVI